MAFRYDIKPNTPDSHQQNPHWLACFVRFKIRDSYNRLFTNPGSKTDALADPVAEVSELLLSDDDIVQWNESGSKQSHIANISMSLLHREVEYTKELAPDDWLFFWAFDNRADYERVKKLVQERKPANDAMDGLKFVGRVDSIRKRKARDQNGGLTTVYSLTGNGFTEFDSTIYYNESIAKAYANVLLFMPDFGLAINEFIRKGRTNPQTAIPGLLRIALGLGPGEATQGATKAVLDQIKSSESVKRAVSQLQPSPNKAYRIPTTVAQLLGVTQPGREHGYTYSDLLRQYIGIQSYGGIYGYSPALSGYKWASYVPDYSAHKNGVYHSLRDLDGEALPYPLNFNKVSVWSMLGTFLNAPINEMYTCLRVDPNGRIMPSFIARQLPLSNPRFIAQGGLGTSFLELPRWVVSDQMVSSIDTGRSNAGRFNYVHVVGQDNVGANPLQSRQLGYAHNKPILDDADIMRSGLRMYDATCSGTIINTRHTKENNPGRRWSHLMSDILMGGHLKFSGTIQLLGVQAPIAEGDNVEVDGVLYHIERVIHQGGLDPLGRRIFFTTLQVTNGISVESDNFDDVVFPDLNVAFYYEKKDEGSYDVPEARQTELTIPSDAEFKVPTSYDNG